MQIRRKVTAVFACFCVACMTLLPIHADQAVRLYVDKTSTPNELSLKLVGVPKVSSISLNLQVSDGVTFAPTFTLSKEMVAKGARVDVLQSSKDTLDIYITSKGVLSDSDTLLLGDIQMLGNKGATYTVGLNPAKTGIKSVSSTYDATTIPSTSPDLTILDNTQTIVDSQAPKPPTPSTPSNPDETPLPNTPGGDANNIISDGNAQFGGNDQINAKMKLQVKEVQDKAYLDMVKKALAGISDKFKVYNVNVTLDGKPITLTKATTLRLPIPKGFDPTKIKVFEVEKQNRSELAFRIEGQDVVFDITHLGNYVIAEANLQAGTHASTGDTTNAGLYVAIVIGSLIVIGGIIFLRKKYISQNEK